MRQKVVILSIVGHPEFDDLSRRRLLENEFLFAEKTFFWRHSNG